MIMNTERGVDFIDYLSRNMQSWAERARNDDLAFEIGRFARFLEGAEFVTPAEYSRRLGMSRQRILQIIVEMKQNPERHPNHKLVSFGGRNFFEV